MVDAAAAWELAPGRAVFLGPLYAEDLVTYSNMSLFDGSEPDALELVKRATKWAGGQL